MAFKRMEGFSGSIPQKFIDNKVPKCPMCGTTNPHWAIDQKMGWLNKYLFKCEQCNCILSATVADISGLGRSVITTIGLAKAIGGKKASTIYMKIDDVGNMQTTKLHEGKEIELEKLNQMAEEL